MKLGLRSAAVGVAALAMISPSSHAVADDGGASPRPHLVAHGAQGAAALQALGDKLPAAAAVNRMSSTRLASILASDHTAWLGADGQLFYKEQPDQALALTSTTVAPITPAIYPAAQTFSLHSNPSSTHKVFLDFDGATVVNTWWNSANNPNPMPNRAYSGFSLDSDPGFSATEHAYIQEVWRIVAEKYAAFDVDVTTEDPGPLGYNRSSSLDTAFGDHVIITDDTGAVNSACGGGCSGVALVGTFDAITSSTDYYQPAWVFSSKTHGSPVLTAHTVAHEVGHTLGLSHDGEVVNGVKTEYSSGHGNWFPLMGSGTYGVGQFSKGEYANANNTEDDLSVITNNGAPVRADDVGDDGAHAKALATGTLFDGVIGLDVDPVSKRLVGDADVFVVNHDCTTPLTARATGIGPGQSLDMRVTVYSAAGVPLASADPASGQNTAVWPNEPTGMDASLTVNVSNGSYYVRVDGVGSGDPVNTGYSSYGSIGEYELAVSGCDGSLPPSTMPTPTDTPASPTAPTTTSSTKVPSAPGVGLASSGRRGHPVTAVARWNPPASNGGAAILGYKVRAVRLGNSGRVIGTVSSRMVSSGTHALTMRLPQGRYRFQVVAYNAAGASPYSAPSRVVVAR